MEITKIERMKELNYFIKRKNKLLVKLIKRERGSTNFNSVKDEKGDIAEDSGISENHKDIRYEAAFHQSKKKKMDFLIYTYHSHIKMKSTIKKAHNH